MITHTFGNGGTHVNLIAAIAGSGMAAWPAPLLDDYTFLQVGDSVENGTVMLNNIVSNKKIYVTTDTPHNGNPNVGHLMSLSPGANYGWWILAGDICIHGLHTKRVDGFGSINPVSFQCQYSGGCGPLYVDFYDNILDGNGVEEVGIQAGSAFGGGLGRYRVYNNKIYDCFYEIGCSISLDEEHLIENNTVYRTGWALNTIGIAAHGFGGTCNAMIRNNVCANHHYDFSALGVFYTMETNASKDASGNVGLTGIVAADEFVSVDKTNDNFLRLIKGNYYSPNSYTGGSPKLGRTGSTPTLANIDIEGLGRPGSDMTYSIGAHELEYIRIGYIRSFILDAGAVYKNFVSQDNPGTLLGATREGNVFTIEQETKDMVIDGAKGPVKGSRRFTRVNAKLTCNFIEHTLELYQIGIPGSETTTIPGHIKLSRNLTISDSDYIDNIVIVTQVSTTGQTIICGVKNALADGNFEMGTEDSNERGLTIQFTAHFDKLTLDEEPWILMYPGDLL